MSLRHLLLPDSVNRKITIIGFVGAVIGALMLFRSLSSEGKSQAFCDSIAEGSTVAEIKQAADREGLRMHVTKEDEGFIGDPGAPLGKACKVIFTDGEVESAQYLGNR